MGRVDDAARDVVALSKFKREFAKGNKKAALAALMRATPATREKAIVELAKGIAKRSKS